MRRYIRVMTAGALLGLSIWLAGLADSWAGDKNPTQESILKLVEAMKKDPNAAKKLAEEIAKKGTFDEVMYLFKPRAKGGIGFDPKADEKKDGIELKLLAIAKTAPAKMELQNQAADYTRMVQVTQAIAEVASYVPPPKALTPGKGPKDWKQYLEDMKKGSKELGEALKAAEPAKVKTSANNLNSACNNCHTDFR